MSLAYAEALTYREDLGGQLGAPELFDSADIVAEKAATLVSLIADAVSASTSSPATTATPASPPIIAFTGAGLSTAAGIPDFRGPDGVWTRQRDGRPPPTMAGAGVGSSASFSLARPTFSHAALAALTKAGIISLIVSQNVDGLHGRVGQPAGTLAELHGNVFAEVCGRPACGVEWVRDFETGSVGRKPTPRRCGACGGRLRDGVLDWEQALPEAALAAAEGEAERARLALALGTSLQITPACELPLRTVAGGGRLVVVNLQATPKDGAAALVVRGRCDDVLRAVMAGLANKGLVSSPLPPPWVRRDAVVVTAALTLTGKRGRSSGSGGGAPPPSSLQKGMVSVALASPAAGAEGVVGPGGSDAFPVVAMVAGLQVWVCDDDGGGDDDEPDASLDAPPWRVRVPVTVGGGGVVRVRVRLGLAPAADEAARSSPPAAAFTLSRDVSEGREVLEWESQRVEWQ